MAESGFEQQVAALQDLLLEQPGFAAAQYNLGHVLYQQADYASAIAAFKSRPLQVTFVSRPMPGIIWRCVRLPSVKLLRR